MYICMGGLHENFGGNVNCYREASFSFGVTSLELSLV
jgi:hypothetical protein